MQLRANCHAQLGYVCARCRFRQDPAVRGGLHMAAGEPLPSLHCQHLTGCSQDIKGL
jgi:hypothetical protein